MSSRPSDLASVQQWMQAVVTHAGGVREGARSEAARRHLDLDAGGLEGVVTRSRALTAEQRLAIYSRSYHLRLLECFRVEYPCLRQALGDDLFEQFVIGYLQEHPSTSYTLFDLAAGFPRHLAESRPDSRAAPDDREGWPDFIVDLATLERAFLEVFDGPGVERLEVPRAAILRALSGGSWRESRLNPVPCLRLLAFRYPVHRYFTAVRQGEAPELPAPEDAFVALDRRDYLVRTHVLSAPQHRLLESLVGGASVGEALDNFEAPQPARRDELEHRARLWLGQWAEEGFILSVAAA